MPQDGLRFLREEKHLIFDETFPSVIKKLEAYCSLVGVYLGMVAAIDCLYSSGWNSFLWAIPFYVAFFMTFVGILYMKAFYRARKRLSTDEWESIEYLNSLASKHLGRAHKQIRLAVDIAGDGSSQKKWNFKLYSVNEEIRTVEHYSRSDLGESGEYEEIVLRASEKQEGKTTITPRLIKTSPHECRWAIDFNPFLEPDQEVDYGWEQKTPAGTHAMTLEELQKRASDYEYFTYEVRFPTEELSIHVCFPDGFQPVDLRFDAWVGGGRVTFEKEAARIRDQKAFQTDRVGNSICCDLRVVYPLQGVTYVVKWRPRALK